MESNNIEQKKSNINTSKHKLTDLKLKHYQAVYIPKKGIASENGKVILFAKGVITVQRSGIAVSSAKELARENNGKVIRGDKALKFLRKQRVNADPSKLYAYVFGKIYLKGGK